MRFHSGKETVLAISDLQAPFQHKDALDFLGAVKSEYSPTKIVCIGDSVDHHGLSDYVTDPDGMSSGDEFKKAKKFLRQLYALFPDGVEVESNHNDRIYRKALKAGIPTAFIKSYKEHMGMPGGWSMEESVIIDGVQYEHGDTFGGMYANKHAAMTNMRSTVIGHHHSTAGINYIANNEKMIFGMNVGCLIDFEAYAFKYARKCKFKPTLGCGVVKKGVPIFIPMSINKKGRWIGSL